MSEGMTREGGRYVNRTPRVVRNALRALADGEEAQTSIHAAVLAGDDTVSAADLAEAEASVRLLALKVEAAKRAVEAEGQTAFDAEQAKAQRAYERRRGMHLQDKAEVEAKARQAENDAKALKKDLTARAAAGDDVARRRLEQIEGQEKSGFGTGSHSNWLNLPCGFPFN